jgi:hypothetical protein
MVMEMAEPAGSPVPAPPVRKWRWVVLPLLLAIVAGVGGFLMYRSLEADRVSHREAAAEAREETEATSSSITDLRDRHAVSREDTRQLRRASGRCRRLAILDRTGWEHLLAAAEAARAGNLTTANARLDDMNAVVEEVNKRRNRACVP